MFVIGTSLQVYPFASLPGYALPSVPRVLLNNEPVDQFFRMNDASVLGDCDESVWKLCQKVGWHEELRKLHEDIGGVSRDWDTEFINRESEESGKTAAEETVETLRKQLADELKLDKEEEDEMERLEKKENESRAPKEQNEALKESSEAHKEHDESSKDLAANESNNQPSAATKEKL